MDGIIVERRVDYLASWIFWSKRMLVKPERYKGYIFPAPIQSYEEAMGKICPICNGVGKGDILDDDGQSINVVCICSLLKWLQSRYYTLNNYETKVMPASLDGLDFTGLSISGESNIKDLVRYLKNTWFNRPTNSWITMEGENGTGKTHIMRSIKTHFGGLCAYISADKFQQSLFTAVKNDKNKDEVAELIDFVSTIPILLIDDWGMEHDNMWTTDTIASIINTRYSFADQLPTVLSFNYSRKTLMASVSMAKKRIVSRIFDVNISARYVFDHEDFRAQETQNTIANTPKRTNRFQQGGRQ